jgi:hypothetical protein
MIIDANDVPGMVQLLNTKFKEGLKWMSYDKKTPVEKADLHLFESCYDAQAFCNKSSGINQQFQFTPVERVLSGLEDKLQVNHQHQAISKAWWQYPVESLLKEPQKDVIAKLDRGEFIPAAYVNDFPGLGESDHNAMQSDTHLPASQTVFVKYDFATQDLCFYNHQMEPVDPSEERSYIEAISFYNTDSVIIKSRLIIDEQKPQHDGFSQNTNTPEAEKKYVKEKQKHSIKPKNRLKCRRNGGI